MSDDSEYTRAPDFIKAWQTSNTVDEVAAALHKSIQSVQARASAYRKRGINLKPFPNRHNGALDIAALNELAASLLSPAPKE